MTEIRPCTKRRYANQRSAERKLSELRRQRRHQHGAKVENHAYRCPHCHAWHLTSQPRDRATS